MHGEPHREVEVRCTTTRIPAIIWAYGYSDEVDFGFLVVFLREAGTRPARVWRPGGGALDAALRAARQCVNGSLLDEVAQRLRSDGVDYDVKLDRVLQKPRPRSLEWVATFYAGSTDLPADARLFAAKQSGRNKVMGPSDHSGLRASQELRAIDPDNLPGA